jgi:hypothetical protein
MVALSQQGADLGFVLGAPLLGAVVGISASLVGMLIPALFGAGKSTEELTDKIKELVKASTLSEAQSQFLVNQTEDEITANQKLLKEAEKRIGKTQKLVEAYDNLAKRRKDGEKLSETENMFLKLNAKNQDDLKKKVIEETAARDTLKNEIDALTKKKKAYAAATGKSLKDQEEEKKAVIKVKTAVESLREQLDLQTATIGMSARGVAHYKADLIGATDAMHDQIDAIYDSIEAEKAKQKQDRENKALTKEAVTTVESIIERGETPEDKLKAEQDLVKSYHEQGLINEEQYQSALTQLNKEGAAARQQIAMMAMGSFSSSFGQIADVLKQSEGEQSTAYKAMFALSKGFAVAQAGLNLSLALSNALASGPFPWNLGAMATVAAAGASFIGSIGSAVYGGREHGGSVISGKTYEVGEKNKPELLMIPGNNGKVLSNAEMKSMNGGGNSYQPIINNYAGADGYSVQYRRDELTKRDVFDIVQSEMTNPNSKGRRGMQSNSNMHGILNGRRRT